MHLRRREAILEGMSIFVHATEARPPKTAHARTISFFYAAIIVAMTVAQLFSFEKFFPLFEELGMPGGGLVSVLLVSCGVFALPFLLGMRLSPAARVVSMVLGWMLPLLWLYATVWLAREYAIVENVGFLGATVPVVGGWWSGMVPVALGLLAAWAAWGNWPFARRQSIHKTAK